MLLSFPLVTEMFHFTRSSPSAYEFSRQYFDFHRNGFPHSDIPGSTVAWDLPEAYRTLPRPSSSNNVKASTVRSLHTTKTHNCAFMPRGLQSRLYAALATYDTLIYNKLICLQFPLLNCQGTNHKSRTTDSFSQIALIYNP